MALFDNVNDLSYATPTSPGSEFTMRPTKGLGVCYRAPGDEGQPALFANTPLEVENRRKFVTFWQEFIDNMDCSHVQPDAGVSTVGTPGALWEFVEISTATGTFDLLEDAPNGVAELNVVETDEDYGVQIQLFPNSETATGECIDPINQHLITWAMAGKMPYPLTSDWFVGIAEDADGTPVLTALTGAINNANYMGFHHLEDEAVVNLVQGAGGTDIVIANPIVTPWVPEDDESPLLLRELGLRIEDNDKLYWYVNGVCVGATRIGNDEGGNTVEAFTDKMTPTVVIINGDGQEAAIAWIDYHTFQMTRIQDPVGG